MCQHRARALQEAKGVETGEITRARQLLQDIEHASQEAPVYFRGQATVFAKPGSTWFSRLVRRSFLL